jgi:glycosyltransferase involved in cell wall biosynthesis
VASVRAAAARAASRWPGLSVRVRVGADSCSDGTVAAAAGAGAEVETVSFRSKWLTLSALLSGSGADWVALLDADVTWDPELLERLLALELEAPVLLGVAPAFGTGAFWRFEARLKALENLAGGPVSVHGATVLYARPALVEAFRALAPGPWLNDDVALPLTLRARFPSRTLFYWRGAGPLVTERTRAAAEWVRRRRVLAGNLEILHGLWPKLFGSAAWLLFLRRAFRVFWAYWFLFLGLGALLVVPALAWGLFLLPLAAIAQPALFRTGLAAGLASFAAPFALAARLLGGGKVSWR